MSTDQPQQDHGHSEERLPSLAALQALHKELLQARRQDGDSDALYERIANLIRRGQLTGALLDAEEDRSTAQAILDYWSAILFKAGYAAPDATLAEFDPDLAPEIPDEACPYVGLDPFREKEQDLFFGRERMVAVLLERLKDDRLLVVVGPSGCGKSSIVLAGLLPALKKGALPDSQNWSYARQMVPGSNPLANLVRVMSAIQAEAIGDPVAWASDQEAALRQNPQHLAELANSLGPTPIVGVVDQFEEVFTLCNDDGTRGTFLDNLAYLVQAPGTAHRLILTMRADFEPFVARFPEFQALFEQAMVRVTPLTAAELRDAIEKPAQNVGLKFEASLVDQLLHDVLGEPAALPLLQFTLLKLWDHRARNRITWQAYNRLGGGRLALARSADDFYDHLIPEDQMTAKRIFLRLVRPGDGLEFTSSRVRLRSLYEAGEASDRVQRVIDKLIAARLVRVTEGDIAADAQIEVAHEALVRNWPRLVDWLEDDRHTLRQRQAVADAAERWNVSGRDPGALYTTETLLDEALRFVESSGNPLSEQETEFIQASGRAQEEARQTKEAARQRELEQANKLAEAERRRADEQARATGRLRRLTVGLILLALAALTAAALAVSSAQNAGSARATAEAGATQVAANLKVVQDSLGAQVSLIDQVATAAAERATLVAQIQTLEPAPTRSMTPMPSLTLSPTPTPRATRSRPTSGVQTGTSTPTLTPRPTTTRTPTQTLRPAMRPADTVATATAMALATQRSAIQATQTTIARITTPQIRYTASAQPVRLTTGAGDDWCPVYAPSGQQIAFFSDQGGFSQLYLLRLPSEVVGPLVSDPPAQIHPHFSPSGDQLIFASQSAEQWEIYVTRTDNYSVTTRLTQGPGNKRYPVFSPNGSLIAFMSDAAGNEDVYLMGSDGSNVRRLTTWSGYDGVASFSPDGRRLVFQTARDFNHEIYSMDLNGSDLRRLTNNPARDADPAWSPDGKWIAFETDRDGNYEIYVMRSDGSGLHNVTQSPSYEWAPNFSPDGRWLVYQSNRSGRMNIWQQPFVSP